MILSPGRGIIAFIFRALIACTAALLSSSLARADTLILSPPITFQTSDASGTQGDGIIYLSQVFSYPPGTTLDFGVGTLFPDPPDARVPCDFFCFANGPSLQVFYYENGVGGPGDDLPILDTQNPILCPSSACGAPTSYNLIFTIGPGEDGVQFALHGDGLEITPAAPVPEPSTWAMLLIGFAAVGFAAYRKRRPSIAGISMRSSYPSK